VQSVPNSSKAHHKLGEALLRAEEPGPALRSLRKALEIAPDNPFAAQTQAQARLMITRRYLPGGPDSPPPDPLPDDAEILHLLGQITRARGNLAWAEEYWEAALAIDSLHAPALAEMGSTRFIQGELEPAFAYLRAAVRQDPAMPSAWFNLGRLQLLRGRREEAVEALQIFLRTRGSRFPSLAEWAQDTLAHLTGR
jgi:tetratricopeptide (TPR) repeat protein